MTRPKLILPLVLLLGACAAPEGEAPAAEVPSAEEPASEEPAAGDAVGEGPFMTLPGEGACDASAYGSLVG